MYRNYIRLTPLQIVGHPCASDEEHHEAEECAEDSGVDEDVRIRLTFVIGLTACSIVNLLPLTFSNQQEYIPCVDALAPFLTHEFPHVCCRLADFCFSLG